MEPNPPENRTNSSSNSSPISIMIVAGEASGDKHGASLARALKRLHPETEFQLFGSGGEEMRAAGVETLVDAREVAVIGVPEITRAIGRLYGAYRTLLGAARLRRPSAVVLIDWPDFNMRLARKLHREGFRIIYYVSPQIWAWRKYRIHALRRDVDRMLVILPFEVEFYKNAGVKVEYVGHPLAAAVHATQSRDEFCRCHDLDPARPIFALLPGSRLKEIHYHLPVMLDAAKRLTLNRQSAIANQQSAYPQFIIPLASTVRRDDVVEAVARLAKSVELKIVERDTYNTLSHSEIAVVASGTATVEAALAGTPMVIIYRASAINWRLIRPLIHLDTFGMVNLIAGRRIVPELMQDDATGDNIARTVTAILSDHSKISRMRDDLKLVRDALTAGGLSGADRAAQAVIEEIRGL
jgi:lipid-A-disaccharide synthase